MTQEERKAKIKDIASHLYDYDMLDIIHYRNDLEEIGCKYEANLLDTIVGKLESVAIRLHHKAKGKR